MSADARVERSAVLYERAILEGDPDALAQASHLLNAAEADLALARGRVMHGEFLRSRARDPADATENPDELTSFQRAAGLYQAEGDTRGEAEAQFWIGCCHQVVRRDNAAAVPVLRRALDLASEAGDRATMAEALRHLGIAAHSAGEFDQAQARLEESTALRREIGHTAGVASNLVGLAYVAIGQGRHGDAAGHLDEAAALARSSNAQVILRQVGEARASL